VLTTAPFNLTYGATVEVKVIAINSYGYSVSSVVGGSASIVNVPDQPIHLAVNTVVTTAT